MGEGVLISSGGLDKKQKINKRPFPFIRQWSIQSEIGHNYYTLGKSLEFFLKKFKKILFSGHIWDILR